MGASWILHTFYWDSIEPDEGEWDFSSYDALVDTAKASGKKVLGVLAYDVWWIHDDLDSHMYIPPEKLRYYSEYVRETVARYRGKVDAWCIWNEPNFSFWNGTREEFLELARRGAEAVREADSEVILLGGAFNRGVLGLPEDYIRGLFETGIMEQADAVAFHPYELNPERSVKLYDQFRALVDEYGFGDKIWITEIGYPTGGWYPTAVSEKQFPAHIIKTFVPFAARGAQKLLWYQLFDPHRRNSRNSEDFFGLVRSRREYRSKGAEAFRLCAVYLSGSRYTPRQLRRESLPDSLQAFYFEGEQGSVLVFWKDGLFAAPVQISMGGSGHIRHDPVSGKTTPIPAETVIKAGAMPVFITWQNDPAGSPCLIRKKP
jgi:hypothetical protein